MTSGQTQETESSLFSIFPSMSYTHTTSKMKGGSNCFGSNNDQKHLKPVMFSCFNLGNISKEKIFRAFHSLMFQKVTQQCERNSSSINDSYTRPLFSLKTKVLLS